MQNTSGGVAHLVKLVDTADTAVGQDEGPAFQHELLRVGVPGHVGGQTDGRGTFTRGVDASGCDLVHVLSQQG